MGRFRALPYAKALLTVVQKDSPQRQEEVASELDAVAAALAEVPEFERVLVTPTVAVEKKTEVLDAVLEALEIGQPTRRFLHVVQQHYRMQHMADIAVAYRELLDESLGRTRVRVEPAAALDAGLYPVTDGVNHVQLLPDIVLTAGHTVSGHENRIRIGYLQQLFITRHDAQETAASVAVHIRVTRGPEHVSGMDDVGVLEMHEGIPFGMGGADMEGVDALAIQLSTNRAL